MDGGHVECGTGCVTWPVSWYTVKFGYNNIYHSYGVQTMLTKFGPESSHSGSLLQIYNVDDFGAKADGITYDTEVRNTIGTCVYICINKNK